MKPYLWLHTADPEDGGGGLSWLTRGYDGGGLAGTTGLGGDKLHNGCSLWQRALRLQHKIYQCDS